MMHRTVLTTRPQPGTASRNRPRGFTLIEVLIALIVLSVGMLGIAGLYVYGMQAGRSSLFRHQAVTLAGDVAERIRANPTAGATYMGGGANNRCVVSGAGCLPAEMAASDILLWKQQAVDTLPNGDVTIVYNNAAVPSVYQITVSWDEAGQAIAPTYMITIPVLEI